MSSLLLTRPTPPTWSTELNSVVPTGYRVAVIAECSSDMTLLSSL